MGQIVHQIEDWLERIIGLKKKHKCLEAEKRDCFSVWEFGVKCTPAPNGKCLPASSFGHFPPRLNWQQNEYLLLPNLFAY
jgi:hypothetical protein